MEKIQPLSSDGVASSVGLAPSKRITTWRRWLLSSARATGAGLGQHQVGAREGDGFKGEALDQLVESGPSHSQMEPGL